MTVTVKNLPHRRMEAWKWTDVRRAANDSMPGLTSVLTPHISAPDGVLVSQGEGHKGCHDMAGFVADIAPQAWNIFVPADTKPDAPLVIEKLAKGHANISVMIDKGASLTLIEYHQGQAGGFVNLDVQIHLGNGAKLTRIIVHDDPDDCVRVSTTGMAVQDGASLEQYTLSFGGKLARVETQMAVEGEGVQARINGAYFLSGQRHTDMTSLVHLSKPGNTIRQSVKGVVTDTARSVFQGKFHVERPAQHTDAEMRHDALMLSDRAEVRAKPELEIYADDVACAHGNTIGALDESALFYMRQRGIPVTQARALLMEAFLTDVFDDLDDDELRESLVGQIRKRLETLT